MSLTDRRFTVKSEEVLVRARGLARDKAHTAVTTGHLLAALFEADSFVSLYLQRLGSEPDRALARVGAFLAELPVGTSTELEPPLSPQLSDALAEAARWAAELDDEYISAENLLLGLAGEDDDIGLTLQAAGVGRGGWQCVIRQRREVWRGQIQPRPEPLEFDPVVARVLVSAARTAHTGRVVVEPAHVFGALLIESPAVGALLAAWGLDPGQLAGSATSFAAGAARVPAEVNVVVVSQSLHEAVRAAAHTARNLGEADIGTLALLRGLARGRDEVGRLLRGVDEMLAAVQDSDPVSRLAGAMVAQQRALHQSDLETASRLLHGEIPALRQEIEALGPAEAALLRLLDERPAFQLSPAEVGGSGADPARRHADEPGFYQELLDALDTAHTRDISRRLLRWLGEGDRPPGDPVELSAFCAMAWPAKAAIVHDGHISGRDAGRAAGRLALLGLVSRDEGTVRLTAAGLRCLEDHGGDPDIAARA